MLKFRRWQEHNRRALTDVARQRKERGIEATAPLSLRRVLLVTHLDQQFAVFAALVGGAVAETYFVRAMQYAAEHDGHDGTISVERRLFGQLVLSRAWQIVSRTTGEKVYDALVESTICVRLSADRSADGYTDERPSCPRTGPQTGPQTDKPGEPPDEGPAEGSSRGARASVHGRVEPARRVHARARGLETPSPSADRSADVPRPPSPSPTPSIPPTPLAGGSGSVAPPPPRNGEPQPRGEPAESIADLLPRAVPAGTQVPLTAGERAAADLIRRAMENAKIRCETTDQAAERQRVGADSMSGPLDQRAAAAERHLALRDTERIRRDAAIRVLRTGEPPDEARALIERHQGEECVRIACLAARKAARADERDHRRAARESA